VPVYYRVPVGGAFTFKQMKKVSKAKQDLSLLTSFQVKYRIKYFQ
jgi:hypothetical protein